MTNDLVLAESDYANMLKYEVGEKQYYAGKVEAEETQNYYHAATAGESAATVNNTETDGIAVIAFEGFYNNVVYTVETSKGYTCNFTVATGVWEIAD